MKDSKISLKSLHRIKDSWKKTIPPIPKDKRTKEYKEWYKNMGNTSKDKKSLRRKLQNKKKATDIPLMPKDKRTKEYKEWYKNMGKYLKG